MTTRLTSTALGALVAFGLTACGGGGSTDPTPIAAPNTPFSHAAVAFTVDPNPIAANHAGNDRQHHQGTELYGFKVNLAFSESAGIGYTVDTVHATLSNAASVLVFVNDLYFVKRHVPAHGRRVFQYTSPLYSVAGGDQIELTCDFTGDITDDRGHSISASNQVVVTHGKDY